MTGSAAATPRDTLCTIAGLTALALILASARFSPLAAGGGAPALQARDPSGLKSSYHATPADYRQAEHRVFRSASLPSFITLPVLAPGR